MEKNSSTQNPFLICNKNFGPTIIFLISITKKRPQKSYKIVETPEAP